MGQEESFQVAYLWVKKKKLHSIAGKVLKTWILAKGKKSVLEVRISKQFLEAPLLNSMAHSKFMRFPKLGLHDEQIKASVSSKHIKIVCQAKSHLHDEHCNIALKKDQFLELDENSRMQNNVGS